MSGKIKYELLKKDGLARLGKLHTNYGICSTPMFMPVGTQATVKTLSPEELKNMNCGVILANTYHLWLRPGEDVVAPKAPVIEHQTFLINSLLLSLHTWNIGQLLLF